MSEIRTLAHADTALVGEVFIGATDGLKYRAEKHHALCNGCAHYDPSIRDRTQACSEAPVCTPDEGPMMIFILQEDAK